MKIVFYSTNSNSFDPKTFFIKTLPSWKEQFQELKTKYPEHEYLCVSQAPAMFLIDSEELGYEFFDYKTHQHFILNTDNTKEIANFIIAQKPDLAIATSFWTTPFDWLPIKDAMVAEELHKNGIKTICHSTEASYLFFNKYETHNYFLQKKFNVPKAVFVNHDLYFCAGNKREVKSNIYKEAILSQIKKLNFPVIIKDNVGLSSYGMQVVNNYGEVVSYLNSKKNNSDRLIEEYIEGEQFGCEIHGTPGNYNILPLFMFSTNQYGITSPKQSVKIGPITNKKYNLEELNKTLFILAEDLKLCGFAQVDLIFSNNKWYIIEVNPRLSGMSTTYKSSLNSNFYEMLLKNINVLEKNLNSLFLYTVNLKFPLLSKDYLLKLAQIPEIKFISQTEDKAAKQEREKGFCEVIIACETKEQLEKKLQHLKTDFQEIVENQFIDTAISMIKYL